MSETLKYAVSVLAHNLKTDAEFKETYVSNISLAFYDEQKRWKKNNPGKVCSDAEIHEISNTAANNFINLFCS